MFKMIPLMVYIVNSSVLIMAKKKSNEELTAEVVRLEKKIQTLEKFMNDEKKQKDLRIDRLGKKTETVDNSLKTLKLEVKSISQEKDEIQKELKKNKEKLQKSIAEFKAFQEEQEKALEKVEERDTKIDDLSSQLKEKEILLGEKAKNLANMENQFSESISKLAKIETENEELKTNYESTLTLQEEFKKKLEALEAEYDEFKSKEEPIMSQNESIRRLLNSSEQGKIYLSLVDAAPNVIKLDDLADIVGVNAVMLKPSLIAMQELEIIEFDPSKREVKLADLS